MFAKISLNCEGEQAKSGHLPFKWAAVGNPDRSPLPLVGSENIPCVYPWGGIKMVHYKEKKSYLHCFYWKTLI